MIFPGRLYLQADVKQSGRDCSEPANDQKDGEDLQVLTTLSYLDLDLAFYLRNYIDQLEQPGGKQFNIQNFMMMYIFGSTTNTEYRTKLFDHWPTVAFQYISMTT